MASLIPNFECDIFIYYRHNDNRSGWVTEFVQALQQLLFKFGAYAVRDYDVTRDGQKFLISVSKENTTSKPVTLMVNWPNELIKNK